MSVNQWEGSTDPEDKSGYATFVVRGQDCRVKLETFSDFHAISAALDEQYRLGRDSAANRLHMLIDNVFRDQFGIVAERSKP